MNSLQDKSKQGTLCTIKYYIRIIVYSGGKMPTMVAAAASFRGIGVPVKLLHEAEGHIVTVELKNGEMLRGSLHEAEDNWNVQLSNVTATARDGKVTHMEHLFIRGSRVRFVIVPDLLKNAPMFKRIDPKNKIKGDAIGMGGMRGRGGR